MHLEKGRPTNWSARLSQEIAVYDLLDQLKIDYAFIDHPPLNTLNGSNQFDTLFENSICKNLFLCNTQQTVFYLLMIVGNKKFITKNISRQINSSRLSFAPAKPMMDYLQLSPGSVSVLGLMNDTNNQVQLLIDNDIQQIEFFGCHPCINTTSLKIRTADLLQKILPAIQHTPVFVTM